MSVKTSHRRTARRTARALTDFIVRNTDCALVDDGGQPVYPAPVRDAADVRRSA